MAANSKKREPKFPQCWNKKVMPHKFDPGCGHGGILKALGFVIDEMKIENKVVIGYDIGCSLLAWDMFSLDCVQTHHGRTAPVMVGFKTANPQSIAIAYVGDGGAYAIGAQHLVNSAYRNDPITILVVNNCNYGMTGGQEAPTTIPCQITATTPYGADKYFIKGPEAIKQINKDAYIARGTISNFFQTKELIRKAIEHQTKNNGFSMVEILSYCPVNWKTTAKESINFADKEMVKYFKLGEL